jgi:hypothetical protein
MSAKRNKLPSRLPIGAKYVLESGGTMRGSILVNRFVAMPDGHRIELAARLVPTCGTPLIGSQGGARAKKATRSKVLT